MCLALEWNGRSGEADSMYVELERCLTWRLSDETFAALLGAEDPCRAVLARLRWPDGYTCRSCGHRGHCVLAGRRGLYQCNRCKAQMSVTAGTMFHATKLPLTTWFAAIRLVMMSHGVISAVELGRRLGIRRQTASTVKRKIDVTIGEAIRKRAETLREQLRLEELTMNRLPPLEY